MAIELCLELPEIPDPFELTLPGGITIERINLLEVIQPILAPLMPLFEIVDTIVAIFNCVKALPDSLGPPPDPTVLAACIPELGEKIAQLLKLLPQLSLPLLLKQSGTTRRAGGLRKAPRGGLHAVKGATLPVSTMKGTEAPQG